jgi:hypothetical protein
MALYRIRVDLLDIHPRILVPRRVGASLSHPNWNLLLGWDLHCARRKNVPVHCSFLAIVDRFLARALMTVEQVTTIVCFGFLPETQGGRFRFQFQLETNFVASFLLEKEHRILWQAFDYFEWAFRVDWVY